MCKNIKLILLFLLTQFIFLNQASDGAAAPRQESMVGELAKLNRNLERINSSVQEVGKIGICCCAVTTCCLYNIWFGIGHVEQLLRKTK